VSWWDRLVERQGEDEVLRPGAVVATAEAVQDNGDLVGHGHAAHTLGLGGTVCVADVIAPHVHDAVGKLHVEPAKGAQLAHAQAREGGGDVDRTVELRTVGTRDGVHLVVGEDTEVARTRDGDALGVLGRVGVDPALALGALEYRVELDEDLLDRAAGEIALGEQALAVRVDATGVSIVRSRVLAPNSGSR
jgi:hypothetical protein